MYVNWGNTFLLTALASSLLASMLFLAPRFRARMAHGLLLLTAFCSILCTVYLVYLQYNHCFQYQYVFEHTSTDLSGLYLVSALWSGQAGSFLLWSMLNSLIVYCFYRQTRQLSREEVKTAYVALSLISFALLLMTWLNHPFALSSSIAKQGLGLNQALQDPWMVVHPPLVFIAYSAMAVLFAMSLPANPGQASDRRDRILFCWVVLAWFFLSAGIISGSLWAYRALGWGGYWAWDPIENGALVPWLLLTVIIHGQGRNRRSFIMMLPFVMALFGTFLARSGILQDSSVHAYTGSAMTGPLSVLVGLFVITMIYFSVTGNKGGRASEANRETLHLRYLKTVTYIFAAFVALATVYPLISGNTIERSFYNPGALAFGLTLTVLFIYRSWKSGSGYYGAKMIVTTLLTVLLAIILQVNQLIWLLLAVVIYPLTDELPELVRTVLSPRRQRFRTMAASISHIGLILMITGIICSGALAEQGSKLYQDNEKIIFAGQPIPFSNLSNGKTVIIHQPLQDVIVSVKEYSPEESGLAPGDRIVDFTTRPLINLLWSGSLLLLIGMLWSVLASYRTAGQPVRGITSDDSNPLPN